MLKESKKYPYQKVVSSLEIVIEDYYYYYFKLKKMLNRWSQLKNLLLDKGPTKSCPSIMPFNLHPLTSSTASRFDASHLPCSSEPQPTKSFQTSYVSTCTRVTGRRTPTQRFTHHQIPKSGTQTLTTSYVALTGSAATASCRASNPIPQFFIFIFNNFYIFFPA